jgi:hypothetical protein
MTQSTAVQERVDELIRSFEAAQNQRGMWESQWEIIARRVLPSYSRLFTSRAQAIGGEPKTEEMVDATAALALTRFAAAMESMLTPRNGTWHQVIPSDLRLMKDRATRLWFEDLTRTLFAFRYAPKANFASQKHEDYMALGAFGTGGMFIDRLQGTNLRGLRYRAIHLGELFFRENHQGIIDTAFRRFELTARQAKQKFGEKIPEAIQKALEVPNKAEQKFYFIHRVQPREDFDPERKDFKGMAFISEYVSETEKWLVEEGGYHTFPYAISRYVTAPGELYGRSPAMLALPAINVLNEEKRTVLKQGHRTVDPVLLAHDDGILDSVSMRPGALNYGGVTADGKQLVHALPVGNLALAKEMMEAERATINDIFLVTLFQILIDTPQMTATEVLERAREKGALLSPTMGRQQSESLGPMIEREIDVLAQQGLIQPMPPALREAEGEYQMRYDSPLSRMARAEEAAGLFRTVDWIREYVAVSQDPTPLDWIDWDTAMPELMDIQAVPQRWKKSFDAVQALRQGRQQAVETQQIIDAAPAAAAVIKSGMQAARGA